MKHYIVTYKGRFWLTYAYNPKEAIFNVIKTGSYDDSDYDWHDFKARSVGNYMAEGKTIELNTKN